MNSFENNNFNNKKGESEWEKRENYRSKEFPDDMPNPDPEQSVEDIIKDMEKSSEIALRSLDIFMPEDDDNLPLAEIRDEKIEIIYQKIKQAIEDINDFKNEFKSYIDRLPETDTNQLIARHDQLSFEIQEAITDIEMIQEDENASQKEYKKTGLKIYNFLFRYAQLTKKAREMLTR